MSLDNDGSACHYHVSDNENGDVPVVVIHDFLSPLFIVADPLVRQKYIRNKRNWYLFFWQRMPRKYGYQLRKTRLAWIHLYRGCSRAGTFCPV